MLIKIKIEMMCILIYKVDLLLTKKFMMRMMEQNLQNLQINSLNNMLIVRLLFLKIDFGKNF